MEAGMVVRAIETLNIVVGAVDIVVVVVEEEEELLKVLAYRLVSLPLLAHQGKKGHPTCPPPRASAACLARDSAYGPGRLSEASPLRSADVMGSATNVLDYKTGISYQGSCSTVTRLSCAAKYLTDSLELLQRGWFEVQMRTSNGYCPNDDLRITFIQLSKVLQKMNDLLLRRK
jgi:hypothetical protein